jgi:hypothetical protein
MEHTTEELSTSAIACHAEYPREARIEQPKSLICVDYL